MAAHVPPAPTRFAFVKEWVWRQYHKDCKRIYLDWPASPDDLEMWDVHASMRVAALINLRDDVVRAEAEGHGGQFPVPV